MAARKKFSIKTKLVNFFGGSGYLLCALQWLFAVIIYSNVIKAFLSFTSPTVSKPVAVTPVVFDINSSLPVMIIAIIVTIAILALSIYVLVKTPSTIIKTTKEVVYHTAEAVTPAILRIQHIEDTQQNHKKFRFRASFFIKILLVTLPVILCFFSQFTPQPAFEFSITMYASFWLAGLSVLFFTLQYTLARLLSVRQQEIW